MKTLVIGDAHIEPSQLKRDGLRRFRWLGELIGDVAPSNIVSIGDFLSMDSLSAWDMDKRKLMENRRYELDIEAGNQALDLFNEQARNCNKYYIDGNHENRLGRYIERVPELEGALDIGKDLKLQERGWKQVPYKKDVTIMGTSFTHVPIMEGGAPVSGKYATDKALQCYSNSVVFGHTHKLDTRCIHRHNGRHLQQALNVGCFFEHVEDYAKGSMTSYWRGIVVLDQYDNNRFDIETYSIGRLRRMYG